MTLANGYLHVTKFSYVKQSDILMSFPQIPRSAVAVAFNSGVTWTDVVLTGSESTFSEKQVQREKQGTYYDQEFSGDLPLKDIVFPFGLNDLFTELVIVKLELYTGDVLIIGSDRNLVPITYEVDTKEQRLKIKFERKSYYPAMRLWEG